MMLGGRKGGRRPLATAGLFALLAGCMAPAGRPGPVVEVDEVAPFLTAAGRYPTQAEAQRAVDRAVVTHGVEAIYGSFAMLGDGRRPASIALFACKPGFYRPSRYRVVARSAFVHCHVDVVDQAENLIGRSTMSFYFARDGWRLAAALERELDAR